LFVSLYCFIYSTDGAESATEVIVNILTQNTHMRWSKISRCISSCHSLWLAAASTTFWTVSSTSWCPRIGPSCCLKSGGKSGVSHCFKFI